MFLKQIILTIQQYKHPKKSVVVSFFSLQQKSDKNL